MVDMSAARKVIFIFLFIYLALVFYCWSNGTAGLQHDELVRLWNHQKWPEIISVAQNLTAVGKPDTESLYFALLAADQLGRVELVKNFAHLLAAQHFLNVSIEVKAAEFMEPVNFFEKLRLLRTRITLVVSVLLIAINLTSFFKRSVNAWGIVLTLLGSMVLLI